MKHNPNSDAEPSRNSQLAAQLAMASMKAHPRGERDVARDEPEIETGGNLGNDIPRSAAAEVMVEPEGVIFVQQQQLQLQQAQQEAQQASKRSRRRRSRLGHRRRSNSNRSCSESAAVSGTAGAAGAAGAA